MGDPSTFPQEYVEKSHTKSKKDKHIAIPESLMIAQLQGIENFERAKKAKDIVEVVDENTGDTYWSYKQLEIEHKDRHRHGNKAHGGHSMTSGDFRGAQACLLEDTHMTCLEVLPKGKGLCLIEFFSFLKREPSISV